jgi:hypothetical protein
MAKNGGRLGEESLYGAALVDYGESLHQMSQVKAQSDESGENGKEFGWGFGASSNLHTVRPASGHP